VSYGSNPAYGLLAAGILPMAPGPYFGRYILQPRGVTPGKAAQDMGISVQSVTDLLDDRIEIDQLLAKQLGSYSDTTPEFWLSLQEAWGHAKQAVQPADRVTYLQVDPYPPLEPTPAAEGSAMNDPRRQT
jgi:plasmid maintenance system antidote protein VapI